MLSFSHRRFLTFAAAGALVFTAVSVPARAEELLTHLGPVGPNEPILTAVGSKRVIAFYEPNSGHCAVNAVVFGKKRRLHRHDHGGARSGQPTAARDGSYRQHRQRVAQSRVAES